MPVPDRRLLPLVLAAATALALAGCTTAPAAAPTATPSATVRPDTARAAGFQDPVAEASHPASAARPTRILIPSIGVDADLLDLRRGADGVLEAPPSNELDKAGWYSGGTVPGQVGPAVIAGHVDWVDRVAVFHRLGDLRRGAVITVVMDDGSRVRFSVDRVRSVEKQRFPTASVYGPTPDAQLRVITCGGPWDTARNIYSENVVVDASVL